MICNMSKKKNPKQKKDAFKYALVIERLVNVQKTRSFWAKETKFLKELMKDYPDKIFWMNVNFSKKVDSLCWFLNGTFEFELKRKYRLKNLCFKLPEYEEISLKKNKCGKSIVLDKKPSTIREFLSNGKNKEKRQKRD